MERIQYRGLTLAIRDAEQEYFKAAAEGRLVLQACADCDTVRYPPSRACPFCGSTRSAWRESAGRGTVTQCLVVQHGVRPDFPPPYAYGLVELDDVRADDLRKQVRMLSDLLAADGKTPLREAVPAGTPVQVTFEFLAEGRALPRFRLT